MNTYNFFKELFTLRGNATLYMVVMLTQLVALEGYGVSNIKVALMALSPVMLILVVPYITKAVLWGVLYILAVFISAYSQDYVRFSTIGYLGMFVLTYMMFYNLVYIRQVFSLPYFIRFLRTMIYAFAICLVLQQVFILVGIRNFPIINLYNQHFLAIDKLPSLTIEPSHTARILGFLYLAYLECCQIAEGVPLSIKRIFEPQHRWVTIGFLYTMTTMGSGTAFIVLMVLMLYFVRVKYLLYIVPLFLALYFALLSLGIKQLDRATAVINATFTGNVENVIQADGSAASRVAPILNTFTMDLTKKETWFGKGTKEVMSFEEITHTMYSNKIGNIDQYGLISFILMQFLVFSTVIRRPLSLNTVLYGTVLGFTVTNIAYTWGCVMIISTVRYFQEQKEQELL